MHSPHFLRALLPGLCLALIMLSCKKEPDPVPPTPSISVSPSGTVSFPAEGGNVLFTVTLNVGYYGYSFPRRDWMSAVLSKEEGKNQVSVTLTANDSGAERTNVITFYGAEEKDGEHVVEAKVTVVQPALDGGPAGTRTTVRVDFGTSALDVKDCELMTLAGSFKATEDGDVPVTILTHPDIPQVTLVCNARGEVVLLSREILATSARMDVNARSSALALVTMHPLFAPVQGRAEFAQLQEMILGASAFSALENKVSSLIKAGKPLFSNEIISPLEALFNEICIDRAEKPQTRATNVSGLEGEGPFTVEVEGKKVSIKPFLLTPMYEGSVYDPDDNKIASLTIPSSADYGITSYFFRDSMIYGDPVSFDFTNVKPDGEYTVYFTRMTSDAQLDLAVNILCSFLDILGAKLSSMDMATFKDAIRQYVILRGAALVAALTDGKISFGEFVEAGFSAAMDFLASEHFFKIAGSAQKAALQAMAKKLNAVMTVYCAVRGAVNTLGRVYFMLSAPAEIGFCLCHTGKDPLAPCSYVTLELIAGDKQKDLSAKWLDKPIRVRVVPGENSNPATWYIVRFTVMDGGGKVSETEVETDELMTAATWWMLGQECELQVLAIDVLDPATRGVISEESLFVTATATDINHDKAPIPSEIQGDWRWQREQDEKKPVEISFTEHTATYRDLEDPSHDFTGMAVWFDVEELVSGDVLNHIRFYEIDPETKDYEMFLRDVRLRFSDNDTKTLFVSDAWGQGFADFCPIPADGPLPLWLWDEFALDWPEGEQAGSPNEVYFDLWGGGSTHDLLDYFADYRHKVYISCYADEPAEPVRFVHTGWNIFGYEIGDVFLVGSGQCLLRGAQITKTLDGMKLHVDDLYGPRGAVELYACGIADF